MAKQRRTTVRGSYLPTVLMAVTVLGMLGFAGIAVAWSLGAFEGEAAAKPIDRTGQLAFPAIVRPLRTYDAVTKDDFIDPRTNQLAVAWLPEANAKTISRSMSELIGRVLKRDKQSGMVLTEADFLEKGTRQGLVAGIPVDKLAMSIPVEGIPGLEQLRGGDRFDLLISLPMKEDPRQLSNSEPAALFGGIKPPSLRVGQLSRQHGVKQLVTDGMLVTLYRGAEKSVSGPSGLTVVPNGGKSRTPTTVATVFAELAVDPDEIGPLTEAIALGTKMICVLHSGLPGGVVSDALSTEGLVPVITTAVPVNAFSALTDENLMDESTGRLHYYYFAADKISKEWISDPAQLYGRVVARPLRRGSFITESDLLPLGTRPGISAGLPAGMAGLSLSKANVQGFENLAVGDSFSILTRVPGEVAASAPAATTWAMLLGGQLTEDDARIAEMVRTGIREVVRDAIFLSETVGGNVIIGIPELEVAKLAQLIRDNVEVFAVARSTQQSRGVSDEASSALLPPSPPVIRGRRAGDEGLKPGKIRPLTSDLALFISPSPPAPLPEAGRGEPDLNCFQPTEPARYKPDSNGFPLPEAGRAEPEHSLVSQNQPANLFEPTGRQGDKVPVPILAQDVPAYKALSIDDFLDPTTGRLRTLLYDPANVRDDWELDVRNLIDRVIVRPLQAGRPVRASDLAPEDSVEGPAIGLASGMRGVIVNSRQIFGLETVSIGTPFDILSAKGIDVGSLGGTVRQSLSSSDAVIEARKLPIGKIPSSRIVAAGITVLADLGEAAFIDEFISVEVKEETENTKTAEGDIFKRMVTRTPVLIKDEVTVRRYVLAVPEPFVGSLLGMLDLRNPLFVSLHPLGESRANGSNMQPGSIETLEPVRAIIQEHVRGQTLNTEVFLTDRPVNAVLAAKPPVFEGESSGGL